MGRHHRTHGADTWGIWLERLKANVQTYAMAPAETGADDHEAIQFLRQLRGGNSHAAGRKARFVKWCLQEIATAAGDTGAYIAQYSDKDLKRTDIAAKVAMLLLADNRAEAALDALHNADQDETSLGQEAWNDAYIISLAGLGRIEEAQAHRWARFAATLNRTYLSDYLKLLPDFEDVEAEDLAKKHVFAFPHFSTALDFCLNWPDLLTAAQLIEARADEINGDHYFLLTPTAEALRSRHPLAAALLWRAMIDFALEQGQSSRYGQAADHLADCTSVDADILEYRGFPTHAGYLLELQSRHHRKSSFWAKVL